MNVDAVINFLNKSQKVEITLQNCSKPREYHTFTLTKIIGLTGLALIENLVRKYPNREGKAFNIYRDQKKKDCLGYFQLEQPIEKILTGSKCHLFYNLDAEMIQD